MENKSNSNAIVAIVCGIVGLVLSFIMPGWLCLIPLAIAIVGIVFGIRGMKLAKETGTGKGMAVAGFVCGIIGTVFSFSMLICAIACTAAINQVNNELGDIDWSQFS